MNESLIIPLQKKLPPGFLPAGVVGCCAEIGRWDKYDLQEVEASATQNAIKSRQQEFATGRILARALLAKLDCSETTIPVGRHREPVWPDAVIGSITHQDSLCIVVASKDDRLEGIGIDLVTRDPLNKELVDTVCTDKEKSNLPYLETIDYLDPYKLTFSIKESVFKCLYPMVGDYFNFHDVSITIDPVSQTAEVDLHNEQIFTSTIREVGLKARYCLIDDFGFTMVWRPANSISAVRPGNQ